MLRFSPMHHEKYVLVVVLGSLRRTERIRVDNDGSAAIAGRNSVRKGAQIRRGF